ncbi:FecR domain-containing protein [Caulobacter sp. X]|uniref:FecR family protein n=1 Tax=Caulobacter sp. X TaxID=2048901 RepID=UPI000C14C541|nr:FecR domain-containing protein [Caulobacter sp. X]PIB95642.1 iron dicitrate transport regulator FecR [Caulobacter sp. X]
MVERERAADIEADAARWVVRIDRDSDNAGLRAELDAWLAGDRRRVGAYARAEAAWTHLDRASVLAAPDAPGSVGTPLVRRRGVIAGFGALAAGLAAVMVAPRLLARRYDTALGEIRRVPMSDGSVAAINTDSALEVDMRPRLRAVKLERGEAWFAVAKDPDRPFVVESGPVRVRAVGTAFSVRKREGGSDVLVTEGVVEVWTQDGKGAPRRVAAGQRLFAENDGGVATSPRADADLGRQLAWRDGQIVLDGQTLAEAAAEFNRYNDRKIVVADPRLADERFVGWFRTNDPEGFAEAAATTFNGKVSLGRETIVLRGG